MNRAIWITTTVALFACAPVRAQQAESFSPSALLKELAAKPRGAAAESLAERLRAALGREALLEGARPRVEGLNVAWAIELPEASAAPAVVSEEGEWRLPLERIGTTPLYAAVTSLPDGTVLRWRYAAGERRLRRGELEVYTAHPDSIPQPGVPKGALKQMPPWESKIFAGTRRDWWVYVPAKYRPESPACVMVFQDGAGPQSYVPTVFDNLIAKGEMPVTVGIFLQPGVSSEGRRNRSFEYDSLSDQYARFLLEEILPEVEKEVRLRQDAPARAIAGVSSGGICAFTVAWQRPEAFSKVMSWVGSFVNIASGPTLREGGHNYPALIRKTTPRKPIRVFLQDGENDLDNVHGNWPLANQEMAKSLAFAGYDYRFVYGKGFHSDRHGRAIMPDALRWLWRDMTGKNSSSRKQE